MAIPGNQTVSSTRAPFLLVLVLTVVGCTAPRPQVTPRSESESPGIPRAAQPRTAVLTARQRFLSMFARAYFPGRTGQLLIVPREGDFITRPDPDVAFMHGSPGRMTFRSR